MKNPMFTWEKLMSYDKLRCALFALMIITIANIFAQSPQAFKYQAVVRNVNGDIITEQNVSVRVSILQDRVSGTIVYSETHTPTTNDFGIINLKIGNGSNVSGDFASIDWGSDDYFLQI